MRVSFPFLAYIGGGGGLIDDPSEEDCEEAALALRLIAAADALVDWLQSVLPDFEQDEDGLGPECLALVDVYLTARGQR